MVCLQVVDVSPQQLTLIAVPSSHLCMTHVCKKRKIFSHAQARLDDLATCSGHIILAELFAPVLSEIDCVTGQTIGIIQWVILNSGNVVEKNCNTFAKMCKDNKDLNSLIAIL